MQLVLIELNEINFEYAKKYFDILKIDTIKKVSKELINTESENSDDYRKLIAKLFPSPCPYISVYCV